MGHRGDPALLGSRGSERPSCTFPQHLPIKPLMQNETHRSCTRPVEAFAASHILCEECILSEEPMMPHTLEPPSIQTTSALRPQDLLPAIWRVTSIWGGKLENSGHLRLTSKPRPQTDSQTRACEFWKPHAETSTRLCAETLPGFLSTVSLKPFVNIDKRSALPRR